MVHAGSPDGQTNDATDSINRQTDPERIRSCDLDGQYSNIKRIRLAKFQSNR
jgi:hypothetical protein